jgi:hypothetical protein
VIASKRIASDVIVTLPTPPEASPPPTMSGLVLFDGPADGGPIDPPPPAAPPPKPERDGEAVPGDFDGAAGVCAGVGAGVYDAEDAAGGLGDRVGGRVGVGVGLGVCGVIEGDDVAAGDVPLGKGVGVGRGVGVGVGRGVEVGVGVAPTTDTVNESLSIPDVQLA